MHRPIFTLPLLISALALQACDPQEASRPSLDAPDLEDPFAEPDGTPPPGDDTPAEPTPVDLNLLLASSMAILDPDLGAAHSGTTAQNAGDVNGDGFDDVVVGSRDMETTLGLTDEGMVHLYLGRTGGLNDTPAWSASGGQRYGYMGQAASGVGDIQDDGYDDLLVGTFRWDNGETDEGRVALYAGSTTGPSSSPAWTWESGQASAFAGWSVAGFGDYNGDGYGDIALGAYLWDASGISNRGAVFVFYGSVTGLGSSPDLTLLGAGANHWFGYSVASAGDLDNNGCDDLVVGAAQFTSGQSKEGAAYVFLGQTTGLSSTSSFSYQSDQISANAGRTVSGAGDVDGDGYDDFLVGIPYWDQSGPYTNGAGGFVLFYGNATGAPTRSLHSDDYEWPVSGTRQANGALGYSVARAGDVDADGYADFVVGMRLYDGGETDEGRAFLFRGGSSGPELAHAFEPDESDAWLGAATGGGGDVDGDGHDDILLSAPYYDNPSPNEGAVFVIGGCSSFVDLDGDGELACSDCDDTDPAIYTGAPETCNGIDDDCDSVVDNGVLPTWYADSDMDTYGDPATSTQACEAPSGWVDNALDCDDLDAAVRPGATEIEGDNVDQDCNGRETCWADADEDGYRISTRVWSTDADCDDPGEALASELAGDCDETNAAINPGADEICNSLDDDCDGNTDEAAIDALTWYRDYDSDGWGHSTVTTTACTAPSGYVANPGDCANGDPTRYPGAPETVGDNIDQSCDGSEICYANADSDAYRASTTVVSVDSDCADAGEAPASMSSGDCDDANAAIHPAATETCDSVDNDCDSLIDDDDTGVTGRTSWYLDADSDDWGLSSVELLRCVAPEGYVSASGDCDDGDASAWPGAPELCDEVDNDCDTLVDDDDPGVTGQPTWYLDADEDDHGTDLTTQELCVCPEGYTGLGGDCHDHDASIHPGAVESCNEEDDDCDGLTDEGVTTTWHQDLDGDRWGSSSVTVDACSAPDGYIATGGDCNDASRGINPSVPETCADGIDQDCDGLPDDGCTLNHCGTIATSETWHAWQEHTVTCNVQVQGTESPVLTIEDGATVRFQSTYSLIVGYSQPGAIDVQGTVEGVLFTASTDPPVPGYWGGLRVLSYDQGSTIDGLTLEYAGYSGYGGVYVYSASPEITDSVIRLNSTAGIQSYNATPTISGTWIIDNTHVGFLGTNGGLDPTPGSFVDNVISGNGGTAMSLMASYAESLDPSSTFTDNGADVVALTADTLDADATWPLLDVPYQINATIQVQGTASPTLTLPDGMELRFEADAGLEVGLSNPGRLVTEGETLGILMTGSSADPEPGDWEGVTLGPWDQGSELLGLAIEYATTGLLLDESSPTIQDSSSRWCSSHGLYATGATPSIQSSEFSHNGANGVYLDWASGLTGTSPSFGGNTVTFNDAWGLTIPAALVGELDSTNLIDHNGYARIYVQSGTIAESATWRPMDEPYYISGDVTIGGSGHPVVTVLDGTRILMNSQTGILVGTSSWGSLLVEGSTLGVTFTAASDSPTAGYWSHLLFGAWTEEAILEGVEISYAGYSDSNGVDIQGGAFVILQDSELLYHSGDGVYVANGTLAMSDCVVAYNVGDGVDLSSSGHLDGDYVDSFRDNLLTENTLYPIRLPANEVGQIAASSSFRGNGTDRVLVLGDIVDSSQTWQDLDVDYAISGEVLVEGIDHPQLSIEAGVALRFSPLASLVVGESNFGSLTARGTSSAPIRFSSDYSYAGAWEGLVLSTWCDDSSVSLERVIVEYGGNNGYGNVLFEEGCDGSIVNSVVRHSEAWGIYRDSSSPTVSGITWAGNALGDLY